MKQGKKPTVAQKKRITEYKLQPNNWLVVKDCRDEFLIINRTSGKVKSFKKN